MPNMSPTTAAIESIAKNLAQACEAARGLNAVMSQDLQSLLRIAGCEAERVRKASRKATRAKASKSMIAAAKKPAAKRLRRAVVAKSAMQAQPRGRRKAAFVNGAAH
jgi:hypothetical protein